MRRKLIYHRIAPFTPSRCRVVVICGISARFQSLFPCDRQLAHALLTRPPLTCLSASTKTHSFDLHVLSTPPAFVLSQDQTLMFSSTLNFLISFCFRKISFVGWCFLSPKRTTLFGVPIIFLWNILHFRVFFTF